MNQVAIKVILAYGHWHAIVMPRESIKRMIDDWRSGKLPAFVSNFDFPPNLPDILRWSFRTADIIGLCEVTVEQPKPQGVGALLPPPGQRWSGN